MPAQRKYPAELRERAVKLVLEIRARDGKGHGELARVSRQMGVHYEALRNWVNQPEIDNGTQPMTEPRPLRIVRALADAPEGLPTAAIAEIAEGTTPRAAVMNTYRTAVHQCATAGLIQADSTTSPARNPGPPGYIWRITDAGRRTIADVDAASELLREARAHFGRDTPITVRRQAAAALRSAGLTHRQIGEVFTATRATIEADLRRTRPAPPPGDVRTALRDIARHAETTPTGPFSLYLMPP